MMIVHVVTVKAEEAGAGGGGRGGGAGGAGRARGHQEGQEGQRKKSSRAESAASHEAGCRFREPGNEVRGDPAQRRLRGGGPAGPTARRAVGGARGRGADGQLAGGATLLAKPLTFMNLSGTGGARSVAVLQDRAAGSARDRRRGAARARPPAGAAVGIGRRAQRVEVDDRRRWEPTRSRGCGSASDAGTLGGDLGDHVLARFEPEERSVIDDAVQRAADAAETFIAEGIVAAMNAYNRKDDRTTDREEN